MPATSTLGDDVTAQAQLGALLRQQLRCALVPVAEVVIVSRHQMDRVVAAHQDPDNKVIPGRGHHLAVKGDHQHVLNAVQPPHQVPPVLRGVDEGTGDAGDHLLRRAVKGEYRGGTAPQGGLLSGPAQQGAVPQVDSVKKAQGNDSFFHGLRSKEILDGRQRSARSPGQAQELPVPAVYAVDAVRCARQGDGIAAADPFLQQAGCQRQGRVLCEEAVRRQQERCTLCLDCLPASLPGPT